MALIDPLNGKFVETSMVPAQEATSIITNPHEFGMSIGNEVFLGSRLVNNKTENVSRGSLDEALSF
jgi:hypothetical protein